MTYSCTDFADSIINALGVEIPDESNDSPSDQADMCLDVINAMKDLACNIAGLDEQALAHMDAIAKEELIREYREQAREIVERIRPNMPPLPPYKA
jgi:hypothetical protein